MVTDHLALKWLQTSKIPKGRRARWIMDLQQFKFTIQHRPGKANTNADALLRMYEQDKDIVECYMVNVEPDGYYNNYNRHFAKNDENLGDEHDQHLKSSIIVDETLERQQDDNREPVYKTIAYTYTYQEVLDLYRDNIRIKQVIAGQPITKGGS